MKHSILPRLAWSFAMASMVASALAVPSTAPAQYYTSPRAERETIVGKVIYYQDHDLRLVLNNGAQQRVRLRQDTVINPNGATIRNDMQVRVDGWRHVDGTFEITRVDILGYGYTDSGYYRPPAYYPGNSRPDHFDQRGVVMYAQNEDLRLNIDGVQQRVRLRPGTVIVPSTQLRNGMYVRVEGWVHPDGSVWIDRVQVLNGY